MSDRPYGAAGTMPPGAAEYWLTEGVLLRRVFAWVVDAILITVVCAVIWALLFMFGLVTLGLGMPLLGVLPFVPFLYTWLTVASGASATPGQAMLGLRVRRNEDLGPPDLLQALVFSVGYYLTMAAGVIWLAVALVTARHRALHDLVSGLVVVRTRALG